MGCNESDSEDRELLLCNCGWKFVGGGLELRMKQGMKVIEAAVASNGDVVVAVQDSGNVFGGIELIKDGVAVQDDVTGTKMEESIGGFYEITELKCLSPGGDG